MNLLLILSIALRSWTLTSVPAEDAALIATDNSWMTDSKSRYCFTQSLNHEAALAGGDTIAVTKGLLFSVPAGSAGNLRLGGSTASLWLGDTCRVIIPGCQAGDWLQVEYMTSKSDATRTLYATNVTSSLPTTGGKSHVAATVQVAADGEVELKVQGGMYIYHIAVGDSTDIAGGGSGSGPSPANPTNPRDTMHTFDITQDFTQLHTTMLSNGPRIYVSPDGDDSLDGSTPATALASIQRAIDLATDTGTTIVLAAGIYEPTERINIDNRNGTHDRYNALVCLDGRAVIRCNHPYHAHSNNPYQGIRLTSSYWYFYHIDVTRASDNGMLIERNKPTGGSSEDILNAVEQAHDNVIDACNFYRNGDTGLQMKNLAAYNYVINCDSYLNCDEDQGDADGFAPKLSVGTGNYFFGCRAYLNSDDGWDVFYKKEGNFGDDKTIILDHCIAYKNGFLSVDTIAPDGNGNGFKCGSDQGAMNVYMNRCLAVLNKAKGFDQNHNSGDIILNNCTALTSKSICGDKAYSYRIYEAIDANHRVELNNCIAINDNELMDKRDKVTGLPRESEHGKNGDYGRIEIDTTLSNLVVRNCEFQRAHPSLFLSLDHTQLIGQRDSLDRLVEGTFAHIDTTATVNDYHGVPYSASDLLVNTGRMVANTTYRGLPVLPVFYSGTAPDLGAYEAGSETTAPDPFVEPENPDTPVNPGTDTDVPQGCTVLTDAQPCTKVLCHGTIYILRAGKRYNLLGQ